MNKILSHLPENEQSALKPLLIDFEFLENFEFIHQGRAATDLFFVDMGCASVTVQSGDKEISIGLVGDEGCVGRMLLGGGGLSPWGASALSMCRGRRLTLHDVTVSLEPDAMFWASLAHFASANASQVGHTSLANGSATLLMRVARLILMIHDRQRSSSTLILTHEAMARVLGVQRPGVTVALHILEEDRCVALHSGSIEMLSRRMLLIYAGTYYGAPEVFSAATMNSDLMQVDDRDV